MADVHMDGAYVPAPAPAAAGREMSEAPAALTGGGGSVASRGPQRKKRTVHQNLGGGKFADILLWRSIHLSGGIVAGMTLVWAVFEFSGYTLLTLLSNTLLVLVAAMFFWANVAHFLNRSPPPIPELELTEDVVQRIASEFRTLANQALTLCHNVALGKEFKLFLKVLIGLYAISMIGSWFSFLTLVYIVAVLLFSVPKAYELYESDVDRVALIAMEQTKKYYEMADKAVLSKMPKAPIREKKSQ